MWRELQELQKKQTKPPPQKNINYASSYFVTVWPQTKVLQ